MRIIDCEQRSDEWKAIRRGKVTSSRLDDVMAKVKFGEAASRKKYKTEIVLEILRKDRPDLQTQPYVSASMQWGIDNEAFGRTAYEIWADVLVDEVGFVLHPTIDRFGASPDGLVGDDGLIEVKCPDSSTHLDYLLAKAVPPEYKWQMSGVLACTEREWCDFVSFDPRFPETEEGLQLFVVRFQRDDELITAMEREVIRLLEEVDEILAKLPHGSVPDDVRRALEVEEWETLIDGFSSADQFNLWIHELKTAPIAIQMLAMTRAQSLGLVFDQGKQLYQIGLQP